MTERLFRQWGQGFGFEPVIITVTIDGDLVYEGPVPTTAQVCEKKNHDPQLIFEWHAPIDFSGIKHMQIGVQGGTLLLAETEANYLWVADTGTHSGTGNRQGATVVIDRGAPRRSTRPGGADVFGSFYQYEIEPGVIGSDPLSNVHINGKSCEPKYSPAHGMVGQWYWDIAAGQALDCDINILSGVDAATWQSDREYDSRSFVMWNKALFSSWTTVPAGITPSDRYYWIPSPVLTWDPAQAYTKYDRVWYDSDTWICVRDSQPGTTPHDGDHWENVFPNWHTPK